jgi:hypothetical protein
LAFSGTLRRDIGRIAVSTGSFLRCVFDGMAGLALVPMGRLFLMRRVFVIVGLEMFLLVLGVFAVLRHEFLQFISIVPSTRVAVRTINADRNSRRQTGPQR